MVELKVQCLPSHLLILFACMVVDLVDFLKSHLHSYPYKNKGYYEG